MDDLQKEWNKRLSKEGLPIIRGSEKVPVDVTMFTTSDRKAPELPPSIDKDADDFAKKRVEEIIDAMKRMIEERKNLDEERRKNVIN